MEYRPNTPPRVVKAISAASMWLVQRSWQFPLENGELYAWALEVWFILARPRPPPPPRPFHEAFFSGSIKTGRGNPYNFPHNSFRWTNGTSAGSCGNYNSSSEFGLKNVFKIVASVNGIIPAKEYSDMLLNQRCFGKSVPLDVIHLDLNCRDCVFPYWSSPALTLAMELLALSKFHAIRLLR